MRKSLIIAAALLVAAPAISHAKTLEELLVEKGVITKAEARGSMNAAGTKVYWNDGTRFEFPDSGVEAGFATFLQTRYTYTDNDSDASEKDKSSFEVTKARVILSGTALHNEFSYYLQSDFSDGSAGSSKGTALKDAYITWHACDWANIRMGQYKTMYNRQFNNSDWKLQFPDRSIASNYFNFGRQPGLSAGVWTEDGSFKLTAGIFNGDSDGEGDNEPGRDTNHTGVVAARYNMGKIDAYSESDVEHTEDWAGSIGAAFTYADDKNDLGSGSSTSNDTTAISVDGVLKYQGFSLAGEFYYLSFDADGLDEEVEPLGFYIQTGYFLTPKKFEGALRYSFVDCDDGRAGALTPSRVGNCAGNDQVQEITVALNYYWWKHNLKGSVAYMFLNEDETGADGDDINTNKWLLQLTSYF